MAKFAVVLSVFVQSVNENQETSIQSRYLDIYEEKGYIKLKGRKEGKKEIEVTPLGRKWFKVLMNTPGIRLLDDNLTNEELVGLLRIHSNPSVKLSEKIFDSLREKGYVQKIGGAQFLIGKGRTLGINFTKEAKLYFNNVEKKEAV